MSNICILCDPFVGICIKIYIHIFIKRHIQGYYDTLGSIPKQESMQKFLKSKKKNKP